MTNQPASGTGGRIKEIESTANPIIKDLKALEKKRVREETGTFLAEGLKLLIDALESGWKIRTLVVSKQARSQPQVEQFAARCVAAGTDMLIVSNKVLQSITRRDNPQMVCGVVAQRLGALA
ncbi:MAG: RNA methyltransferase substrate-binding domain-containing protein, partial [Pseudomonadota bacterium]